VLSPRDGVEQGDGHGEEVAWTYGEKVNAVILKTMDWIREVWKQEPEGKL